MKEQHRINMFWAGIIYLIAFVLDLISLVLGILGVNFIGSVIAFGTLVILFKIFKASYIKKPKKLIRGIAVMVIGSIPIVGMLPIEQVIGVFLNLRDVRKEDREYNNQLRLAMEQQIEEENRIRQALWLRQMKGINSSADDIAKNYLSKGQTGRQKAVFNFNEQSPTKAQQQPSRTGGLVKRGAIKAISVVQPEIGAAIAVANRVKQVENIVGRKITPRPGYNTRA